MADTQKTSTDISIAMPEKVIDTSNMSIQVMNVLQSTLKLEKLIELFDNETCISVQNEGLAYSNDSIKFEFRHQSTYSITCHLLFSEMDLGKLTISRDTPFTEAEIKKIKTLIYTLIHPLKNALLYKKAIEKAYLDPLTGLNNRAAFDSTIQQEIEFAFRYQQPLSLMMLDLDRFKQINDTYGHIAGDVILKRFSKCIRCFMRISDIAFRYGGEEFTILLRNTDLGGAKLLAERTRKNIKKIDAPYNDNHLHITTSIGVSELKKSDDTDQFVYRTDKLLYRAKENGRDCVVSE